MKLTDPDTIRESEKEFIDTINAELDWEAIEKMLFEKHNLTLQEEIDYKNGNILVHNNEIAYKFDFEIKIPLSVIFNGQGNCLEISTIRDDFDPNQQEDSKSENLIQQDSDEPALNPEQEDKTTQLALNIADMISEINK